MDTHTYIAEMGCNVFSLSQSWHVKSNVKMLSNSFYLGNEPRGRVISTLPLSAKIANRNINGHS